MLTAKKFASRAGLAYGTVMAYLRAGRIPDAVLVTDSPLGPHWQIPVTAIPKIDRPKRGRKPTKKARGPSSKEGN